MIPFVFFGTPYVAKDTLDILFAHGYAPLLIVTNPDAPKGRGHVMTPSDTKVWAEEHNVPVITPERITPEVTVQIRNAGAEVGICVAYGKILPEELIHAFPKGILNIHYSLLPKYRGASPVEAALLEGDTVTGVTLQRMVKALDAGDILGMREVAISEDDTTESLRPKLIIAGGEMLIELLPRYMNDEIIPEPQDVEKATHVGKIPKEAGLLDMNGNDRENWNKYRAYKESPGTYFFTEKNGKTIRVKITEAAYENNRFTLKRVIPEGKKEMLFEDFIR